MEIKRIRDLREDHDKSQQEIADTLGFTKSKVNSIIRELIQKGYVTQVNARGKYALTENANRELRNMHSKEAVV